MNYYYDLVLNFLDGNYLFYEWDDQDNIEYIKKIPLFHVTCKQFLDIYQYNGKVDEEFLKEIENKTISKKGKLKYACLIADKNNVIALEFNHDGYIITRSSLMLKDELGVLEYLYAISIKDINFIKEDLINQDKDIRMCLKIKKFIELELNKLFKEKNKEKLCFLYFLWFNEKCDDLEKMANKMKKRLTKEIEEAEIKIYDAIKLSYNNV